MVWRLEFELLGKRVVSMALQWITCSLVKVSVSSMWRVIQRASTLVFRGVFLREHATFKYNC